VYQAKRIAGSTCLAFSALSLITLLAACDPSPASLALRETRSAPPDPGAAEAATGTATEQPPAGSPSAPPQAFTAPPPRDSTAAVPTRLPEPLPRESFAPIAAAAPQPRGVGGGEAGDRSLELLGERVPPGSTARLTWAASEVFEGMSTATPVLVVNGKREGPVLCLTAAIHGDELNGIEMVRRVLHELDADELRGAVIGVPIVNLQGFRRGSRYLPDRRDLNRYFPGNPEGSSAARIAHSLFQNIVRRCNALVDLHTGSFYRTNLPQLRADLRYRRVREMTQAFGGMAVLHSEPAFGTLRRAATEAGIPAVTLEAGEPLRLQSSKVNEGVSGIFALLSAQDMVRRVQLLRQPEPVFYESAWVRADHGGILFSVVRLGQAVAAGDVLGTVTDPITNEQHLIYASDPGRVLGMAVNQVVMPGFAAFRIGTITDGPPSSLLATDGWGQTGISDTYMGPPAPGDEPPAEAGEPAAGVVEAELEESA
jgi:predicted deacylase